MKITKRILSYIITISCVFSISGCADSNTLSQDYKFGVLYSSNDDNSVLSTYSSDGEHIYDKKIEVGGITFASFMAFGEQVNNYMYYPCPVYNNQGNDYVLQLNTDTLETSKISSEEYITPTFFSVDEKYLYSGSSSLEETYLSKTKLDTNDVEKTLELEGQGIFCVNDQKKLYVISIIHSDTDDSFGKISIIDKSNFTLLDSIDIEDLSFTSDAKLINNTLYILKTRDGKDNLSNNMIKVDLDNKTIKTNNLPFDNLFKIHTKDNYMYVVEANYNGNNTNNKIAKINLENMKIKNFVADNKHISSCIQEDNFISCDGENVYIYDLENFVLVNSFNIKQIDNQVFVSLYTK